MPFKTYFRKKLLSNRVNRVFRASISMFFYAGTGTILAAVVYFFIGAKLLSIFIMIGGVTFFAALFIYMSGKYKAGIIVSLVAVSIITVAGDIILGIESGAHYFILAGVMLYISADKTTLSFRYISVFACIIEFILICVFLIGTEPVIALSPITISVIDKINLLTAFGAIGFAVHIYVIAVIDQEIIQKEYSLRLLDQANSDQLTGLPNRRFTYKQLEFHAARSKTRGAEFVIGLADIDDFKHLNDTFGHVCGDEVLIQAGVIMKNTLRNSDIVGRWGGEEFLIILPNTGHDEGSIIIERLRQAISEAIFFIDGNKISVTMTIGVSVFTKTSVLKDLIREADTRLYKGKNLGKNCVMEND